MTSHGNRGRRNNGLDAVLWSPLRDVDPRIGEHLLDVLSAAGIAAYLEPSADIGPYTRTVFLPSPPSDRLFVDRSRRAAARALVDGQVPQAVDGERGQGPAAAAGERAGGPVPERAAVGKENDKDLDEDAEWSRIVAAFEAELGRAVVDEEPAIAPPPAPHEPGILDLPDEHYEPPPPPPLPVPAPASLYALLLVVAGVLLIWAPGVLRLSSDLGLVLGVASVAAGAALLG